LSNQLSRRLRRLLKLPREEALKQAERVLTEHFEVVLKYTFRSHVQRDLEAPLELSQKERDELKGEIALKLEDFKKILDDAH